MKRSQASLTPIDSPRVAVSLYVASSHAFNSDVLSSFLEAQTRLPCRAIDIAGALRLHEHLTETTAVIFMDCQAMGTPDTCKLAARQQCARNENCRFICYNVAEGGDIEVQALNRGIRGILYNHQSTQLFARAAVAVLDGELWFPRRILENYILTGTVPPPVPANSGGRLTRRETQILEMLAAGASNPDIAAALFISPHTVKTHIYNLYRKIQVANRFQAAQWLRNHA